MPEPDLTPDAWPEPDDQDLTPAGALNYVVTALLVLFLAGGLVVLGYALGRAASAPDPEVERLRLTVCVLLDELGADSLGATDLLACPPR